MKTEQGAKVTSLLDKEQRALVETLKLAHEAAVSIFKTPTPTAAMVGGVFERAFGFEEEDDIELSIRELHECESIARDVFKAEPTLETIFLAYDVVFEEGDE